MLKIYQSAWKNLTGIFMENEMLKVVVLPGLGGKTASVYHKPKGFELAAQNRDKIYRLPDTGAAFSDYDASGIDDAFPSIDASEDEWQGRRISYPDHGEIWSGGFSWEVRDGRLRLSYSSRLFPFSYEKTISLEESSVIYQYRITSPSGIPFPCLWAFHGLVRQEDDMEFFYPDGTAGFVNVLESRELGKAGELYGAVDSRYDFSLSPGRPSNTMVKYYVRGRVREGRCGCLYPSQGMRYTLEYDARVLPYLGVWITAGGFRGDYNCALEPASGYYDSIPAARESGSLFYLSEERPLEFSLKVSLDEIM